MCALRGLTVVVTRPDRQAVSLCRLLENRGAVTLRLPVVDIEAVSMTPDMLTLLRTAGAFDLVIFTSANAVTFGASMLETRHVTLAAIGPATARALGAVGLHPAVTPDTYDSEGLLRHPRLAAGDGQRVLIVTGRCGRDLLRRQLGERGARVTIAEVYQRKRREYGAADLAALEKRFSAASGTVVTATSVAIVSGLLELATPALMHEFARVHWLVPGVRVATAVRALGLTAPILEAASAEDHDLVVALERWRSEISAA